VVFILAGTLCYTEAIIYERIFMGVCTTCNAEVADDQLMDGQCATCTGGAMAEAPAEGNADEDASSTAPAETSADQVAA
jgi:hypothetical protein